MEIVKYGIPWVWHTFGEADLLSMPPGIVLQAEITLVEGCYEEHGGEASAGLAQ